MLLRRGSTESKLISTVKGWLIKVGYTLNDSGANKGVFGPKMEAAVADFQEKYDLQATGEVDQVTFDILQDAANRKLDAATPWRDEALKHLGKNESNSVWDKFLSGFWKIVGLPGYKTIKGNTYAWCGLFVAMILNVSGYMHLKSGAGAKNWARYGYVLEYKKDGIPKAAIIHIDHDGNCSGGGNHVTIANGSCTAEDLAKRGATVDGLGGNQGNKVSIAAYPVSDICAVTYPNKKIDGTVVPRPEPVTKSDGCNGNKPSEESTR